MMLTSFFVWFATNEALATNYGRRMWSQRRINTYDLASRMQKYTWGKREGVPSSPF
jgi:hypothetical protein